jgi:hypothetical protein
MSKAAVELDKIHELTGVTAQNMQKMDDMASQSGIDMKELAGTIEHLQEQRENILLGRGDASPYFLLGLNANEDPIKLLDQLSEKLKTLSPARGTTLAHNLGLSDDLIYFLKNKENLKPVNDETIVSDKEIRRLKEFNIYFNHVWKESQRVLQRLGSLLTPLATGMLYAFERITTSINHWTTALMPIFDESKGFLETLVIAGALVMALLNPKGLIGKGSAWAVFLLMLDDLSAYFEGKDSLFGRMLNYLSSINNVIELIVGGLGAMINMVTMGHFEDKILRAVNFVQTELKGEAGWLLGENVGDEAKKSDAAYRARVGLKPDAANSALTGYTPWVPGDQTMNNNVSINVTSTAPAEQLGPVLVKHFQGAISDTYFQQPIGVLK